MFVEELFLCFCPVSWLTNFSRQAISRTQPALDPKRRRIMARPIEATPVLKGKAAAVFLKAIQNPKPYTPPVVDMDKLDRHVKKYLAECAKK
jgi:hypothetical protein